MLALKIIVILGFVLMHTVQIHAFGSRAAGRITKRVALGTTLAETIIKLSGFSLILFLPALAYLVESGISIYDYLILITLAYFLTFLSSVIMIIKLNSLQKFYQIVFLKYNKNTIPVALFKSLISKKIDFNGKDCKNFTFELPVFKKTLVSFISYIFFVSGYFFAFMLAVLYPENRLTVSQFTTLIHAFGILIFAVYLDPMLSRSIDNFADDTSWLRNFYSILLGRMLSYFVVFILLSIFILFKFY
jgi:hypothetical protein